jgi:hypothetical protein
MEQLRDQLRALSFGRLLDVLDDKRFDWRSRSSSVIPICFRNSEMSDDRRPDLSGDRWGCYSAGNPVSLQSSAQSPPLSRSHGSGNCEAKPPASFRPVIALTN